MFELLNGKLAAHYRKLLGDQLLLKSNQSKRTLKPEKPGPFSQEKPRSATQISTNLLSVLPEDQQSSGL